MKANVYHEYGSPDVLELREIDKPLLANDGVLVRVRASSVNPADWHTMMGTPYLVRLQAGLRKPKSEVLGVDFAGTVEAVGRDVTQFQPGDEVFGGRNGAFAEYVSVPEDRAVVPKPANLTFEQAAAVPVAAISALQGLRDKGQLRPAQKVLINSASGGVGTFAVQIAKAFGAEVTGVCSTRNVELVRSLGADRVIDYTQEDFTRGEQRYDVMLDIAGNRSWSDYKRILNDKATLVVVGGPKTKSLDWTVCSFGQSPSGFTGRKPQSGSVPGEGDQRGSGRPARAARGRKGDTGHRPTVRVERDPRSSQVSRRRSRSRKGRHHRVSTAVNRALKFPATRRDPDSGFTLHGRRFDDPYAWLERLDDPETRAWIAAQEAVTHSVLRAVPGRDWLRAAVARSARYARLSPPIPAGPPGRQFLWQADAADEKLKLMLRRSKGAPLEAVLDPNTWASDEVLVFAQPSPDGALVAFGKAVGSTHDAVIHVLDVETGRLLPDRPRGTSHESLAWRPDSSGFFYVAYPEAGEVPAGDEAHWSAVYEHRLGSGAPARRVFGDDQVKEYWCSVNVSECGRFAVLYKWDFVHANVVYLLRLSDDVLVPVAPDMGSINRVQVIGDSLLVHTDLDAPRGRLCVAPLTAPTEWRTLIPENADTLQTVAGVGGQLYAVYLHAASHCVRVYTEDGAYLREVVLPALGSVNRNEGGLAVSGVSGSWTGDEVWLSFESYVQAPSLYRYDYAEDRLTPYYVPDAGIDASAYVTDQVFYESRDGTRVSMFIIHRKGLPRDGRRPVRLSGYGGFNVSMDPRFRAMNAAWLKLGGVLAYANIRGGGEYGRAWHEAGRKTRRQNTYDDYIAAARWLVSAGYTTPSKLASRGNSNGGLLVAVTAMQAPEAFGAVFSRAPILDLLRFPKFGFLSAATVEHGSPDDPVEGAYLIRISPYHNVRADRRYPVMMFVPALNDRIAPPYDPLKMVARLQAEATQGGPYLLLPLRASGHAGGTTLTTLIEQDVDELAFCCWALDVAPPSPGIASGATSEDA